MDLRIVTTLVLASLLVAVYAQDWSQKTPQGEPLDDKLVLMRDEIVNKVMIGSGLDLDLTALKTLDAEMVKKLMSEMEAVVDEMLPGNHKLQHRLLQDILQNVLQGQGREALHGLDPSTRTRRPPLVR